MFYLRARNTYYSLSPGMTSIGRSPYSRIRLHGPSCSREHAVITVRGKLVFLHKWSGNSICVNDRLIERFRPLNIHDRITFPNGVTFVLLDYIPTFDIENDTVVIDLE